MHETRVESINDGNFFKKAGHELRRAERYRLFVSLLVLDLSYLNALANHQRRYLISELQDLVRKNVRIIDFLSLVDNRLLLMLPETSRQGAEIAARRLGELIRTNLLAGTEEKFVDAVPVEMASFPDAAGVKSLVDLLRELSQPPMN
ncbi:MAG TPA: hypothetical protein VN285_09895 [Candidatus Deferrimicrobium sp.]|nr:hypothetical protein [Candidatus Deferrimicrobium sp.]